MAKILFAAMRGALCYSHLPMKYSICNVFFGLCVLGSLQACGPTRRSHDVWDTYDVRHETPNMSAPYIDNDSYYAAPSCSIMDSPSCGGD